MVQANVRMGPTTASEAAYEEPREAEKTGIRLSLGEVLSLGDYVVYTFYLSFQEHSWRVRLRYSEAARALAALDRLTKRAEIALPSLPRRTWRLHETECAVIGSRARQLTRYLSAAVARRSVWEQCIELRELLEVGSSSFARGLGPKGKEGYVLVTTTMWSATRKWVSLRSSCVAVYDRSGAELPSLVLAVDARFGFIEVKQQSILVEAGGRRASLRPAAGRDAPRKVVEWLEAFEATYGSRPRFAKPKLTAASDGPWERTTFRYESFAPRRQDASVEFLVCGKEYFLSVLEALRRARRQVFIADWRLNPGLLLRRDTLKVALDDELKACVDRGCQVYALLYREFSESLQSKHKSLEIATHLQSLGVHCLRHPNHLTAGQVFWSHHEKLVVVDQTVAFVGGLDLVEGRYCEAVPSRRLRDDGWSFEGAEFYQPNARPPVDRSATPRQPWQDIACRLSGTAALDVALHFVQRWNHHRIALGQLQEPVLIPFSDVSLPDEDDPSPDVQVVRSAGKWSLGLEPAERSVAAAWCDAIRQAESSIYIEQQFFFTTFETQEQQQSQEHEAPSLVVVPPGVGEGESFAVPVDESRWVTVEVPRGCGPGSTLYVHHRKKSHRQRRALPEHFFDTFKTAAALVSEQRNDVGAALLDRLRRAVSNDERDFKVLIVLPLHPNGRFLESQEVRALMQQQYASLCRGPSSLLGRLAAEFPSVNPFDMVGLCSLRAWDHLDRGPASEMVYVHSKCLVVDDSFALVGSANVNDRSLLGDRDSEVACVVRDPPKVAAFRKRLWRLHAGTRHDPTWAEMLQIARRNSELFESAFDGRPWNEVATIDDAKRLIGLSRVCVPVDDDDRRNKAIDALDHIQGSLCLFPLNFLSGETLAPSALANLVVGSRLYQ